MKNVVIVVLTLIVLALILFKTSSPASPVNPPTTSSPSVVGPRNNQTYYFVNATDPCPSGYSKPDPAKKPTICKINNS